MKISTLLTTLSMVQTLIILVICLHSLARKTVAQRYTLASTTTCNSKRCVEWETFLLWVLLQAFQVKFLTHATLEQVDIKDMFLCQVVFLATCVKQLTSGNLCLLDSINQVWRLWWAILLLAWSLENKARGLSSSRRSIWRTPKKNLRSTSKEAVSKELNQRMK